MIATFFLVITIFSAEQRPVLDITLLDQPFDSVLQCKANGERLSDRVRQNVFSEKVKDSGATMKWECRGAR